MKTYNYNYIFVLYDVDEKRCPKVFKVCKKYLLHYQKSVFRGEITPSQILHLKRELMDVIDPSEDYVSILKMRSKSAYTEEEIGKSSGLYEDLFI